MSDASAGLARFDEPLRSRLTIIAGAAGQSVGAIIIALLIGLALVLAIGADPGAAYGSFILGSFRNPATFGNMLSKAQPLLIEGIAVMIAFRAGAFNIGGEGQMYVGALAGAVVALAMPHVPGPLIVFGALLVGGVAGGLWGAIPGYLRAYLGVNEVVTTLMLNYVGILITEYLVNNQLRDPQAGTPATPEIPAQAWLPGLLAPSTLSAGLFLAVALTVVIWFVLFHTVWGANLRMVGSNPRFAETIGIDARAVLVAAMIVSGAVAGIGGVGEVLGTQHRFDQGFSPGFGFIGLTVALLGRLNPWGVAVMALIYATLLNGAAIMQIDSSVPFPLVNVITGIIVVLMTAEGRIVVRRVLAFRRSAA